MSEISTIFDALYTRMATLYPNHKELVNPRAIELNDDLFLVKGYALNFGASTNTNRTLDCKVTIQRDLVITLTRQVFGTDRDTTIRKNTEKQLLEDQFILFHDIEKDPTLNNVLTTNGFKVDYIGDSGIQEIFVPNGHYLMIQNNLTFEYFAN